ncbi:MAG: helix-turn-helix transcriptional regulator [Burkholderiaceae bacterium]
MTAPLIDDAVLEGLYEAAAGLRSWPQALRGLVDAFDALISQLIVVDRRTGQLLLSEQPEGIAVDGVIDYAREYHRSDPHAALLAGRPVGELLDTSVDFPRQTMLDHRFYAEFWSPYGVQAMLAAKIAESERHIVFAAILRSLDQPAFSDGDLVMARRYFQHLITAFRVSGQIDKARSAATVGERLLETADRPMFLLDVDGTVLNANRYADDELRSGAYLICRGGVLDGRSAQGSRLLRASLDHLRQAPADRSPNLRLALRLPGVRNESTEPVALCTFWRMVPEQSLGAFGSRPIILMSVIHPRGASAPDAAFIAAMFDLTPAEGRVAALLAIGEPLDRIAEALGVSINTIRAHLAHAMQKTGTRRQSDLVALLLRVGCG